MQKQNEGLSPELEMSPEGSEPGSLKRLLAIIFRFIGWSAIVAGIGLILFLINAVFLTKYEGYGGLYAMAGIEMGIILIPLLLALGGVSLFISKIILLPTALKPSKVWMSTLLFCLMVSGTAYEASPLFIPQHTSVNDDAWQMMYDNRVKIAAALPREKQADANETFYFLCGEISHIKKSDAREIRDIISSYLNGTGRISDRDRSEAAIASLSAIEHRYEYLRPQYRDSFGPR